MSEFHFFSGQHKEGVKSSGFGQSKAGVERISVTGPTFTHGADKNRVRDAKPGPAPITINRELHQGAMDPILFSLFVESAKWSDDDAGANPEEEKKAGGITELWGSGIIEQDYVKGDDRSVFATYAVQRIRALRWCLKWKDGKLSEQIQLETNNALRFHDRVNAEVAIKLDEAADVAKLANDAKSARDLAAGT